MDKCEDFFNKVLTTYYKCQTSSKKRLDDLPPQEENLQQLHTQFQEDEHSIPSIKNLHERVLKNVIAQAAVSNFLLEDQL